MYYKRNENAEQISTIEAFCPASNVVTADGNDARKPPIFNTCVH